MENFGKRRQGVLWVLTLPQAPHVNTGHRCGHRLVRSGSSSIFFFFCKTHLLHTRKQKMHFKKPTKLILSVLNAQPAHLIYFFTFWQSNWHRIWNHLKWIRSSLPRKYIYVPRDAVPTKYLVMSFLIICPKEDGEGLSAYLHGDNIQIWTTPASKRAISPLANTKQSAGDMVIFQKHSTLPNIWDSFAYTYTASRPKISGQF